MPTNTIHLTVTRGADGALSLYGEKRATRISAGSQYDNLAYALMFERDQADADDALVLYFTGARVVLGAANEYEIPAALTQDTEIKLEVAYMRDGEELEHSNVVSIMFRSGIPDGKTPPQPMPDTVLQLADGAFTDVARDGDQLVFSNLQGEERGRVSAGGGGGTGDHRALSNRGDPDQHPIEAVTGLADALNGAALAVSQERDRATVAETDLQTALDGLSTSLGQEVSARQQGDETALTAANAHTDAAIQAAILDSWAGEY